MEIITPTNARKDIYRLIKEVNQSSEIVMITGKNEEDSAVLVSKREWEAIQETLYLDSIGVMAEVTDRQKENDLISMEEINWDTL